MIEARGMPEIRQYYRDRARRIGEAHLQAKKYLENCLDNLNGDLRNPPLDPRAAQIISEFFGAAAATGAAATAGAAAGLAAGFAAAFAAGLAAVEEMRRLDICSAAVVVDTELAMACSC